MIAEVSARVEQDASGAAVVKTFIQRRGSRESEFEQVSRAYMESNVEATRVISAVNPTLSAIRVAGVALILYLGGMLTDMNDEQQFQILVFSNIFEV